MSKLTIWKYRLTTTDTQYAEMPKGAKILAVQMQNEVPCLWALVDPDQPKMKVKIAIFGTGHPIDERWGLKYIGTYQLNGGLLVFHVFEMD